MRLGAVRDFAPPEVGDEPTKLWEFSPQVGQRGVRDCVLNADEYRAVFDGAPDGILVVSSDGVIRDVNPQVEAMFGYAREEFLGEPVEMLVPEVFRTAHAEHRRRFDRNPLGRPMGVGLDLRGRRKDGSEIPVEISLSPWASGGQRHVICTVRDVTDRKRLRDFSEGALRSVEEERQRIARELHDDTAQRLATLMLRVRLLGRVTEADERIHALEELRDQLLQTAEGVKRIARGLRPPELEDVGLNSALRAHLRDLRDGTGFVVDAEVGPVDSLLDDEGKLAIYRIVQEALSNVIRHSGTDRALLRVRGQEDLVTVEVEDDGRGFSAGRVSEQGGGLGLVGMQERALMLGGRVMVDSVPGQGTRVRLELPVSEREAQNV
jgi:PAS domain S-box-containing protein